uniref:Uncharacterized protein n=1 Tax=Romanomermis culicivorax TaxID=13658 RepID=A0A915IRA9_ROMCU
MLSTVFLLTSFHVQVNIPPFQAENEAKEAEEMLSKITNGSTKNLDEKELENLIVSRAKNRESFLDQLAAKYETKAKNKTKVADGKKTKTTKKK